MDATSFEKFLHDSIKINNKAGLVGKETKDGKKVTITREGAQIIVNAVLPFSKRYVKYLTKKYLKKQELRDYLRVVSSKKDTYELRYLAMNNDEE